MDSPEDSEYISKSVVVVVIAIFCLYLPLGDPQEHCVNFTRRDSNEALCCICDIHTLLVKATKKATETFELVMCRLFESLYEAKLMFYSLLETLDRKDLCRSVCCSICVINNGSCGWKEFTMMIDAMRNVHWFIGVYAVCSGILSKVNGIENIKDSVDELIEDEITKKLSVDLLQSIEKKFHVDLEKSVDMVLLKIKLLLQNGTTHIQDRLTELQATMEVIKNHGQKELETCLKERQNETVGLAEKALHQMVVCGYALIGHDPAKAVSKVLTLKNMISEGIKPIYEQRGEVLGLLKVCGHDHETLKKVIKCVISKSPNLKSAMMEITNNLIEGVVDLTKLMAHGAMHEACLIEVVHSIEEEAFLLVKSVKTCVYNNETESEVETFISDNNATVLDLDHRKDKIDADDSKNPNEIDSLLKIMQSNNNGLELGTKNKKLKNDLHAIDNNRIEK